MKYYGFTFMRGVEKLDYPFVEMMHSLSGLVEKIYVALGDSDDGTEEALKKFNNVEIIRTVWQDKFTGDGGKIFSQQANIALEELRKNHRGENAWAIFLHCDEIIHHKEYDQLLTDINDANVAGYDAVKLRFLHFWKDHYHVAVCKRWHPAEIRAMKVDSDVFCYGDAQGFRGFVKEWESDVSVLHYGHVRDADKHDAKQREILKRIRPADKFKKYYNREKKIFAKTKTIPLLIDHPSFMRDRIERMGEKFFLPEAEKIYIVGKQEKFSTNLKNRINAKQVIWVEKISDVPPCCRKKRMVVMEDSRLIKWPSFSKVPNKMDSPHAKEWNPDMQLLLRLSEKSVGLKLLL